MRSPIRISRTQLAVALAAIVASASVFGSALAQADAPAPEPLTDDPNAVVIVYGDTEVTLADFDVAFDRAARSTAIGQGLDVNEDVLSEFAPFRAGFLSQYGTQRVLAAEAEARDLTPSPSEVDSVVTALRDEQPDGAAFAAWLTAAGYADEAALRDTVSESLAIQALVDALASDVSVDPDAVAAWYDANPEAVTAADGERMPLASVEDQTAQLLVQEAVDARIAALTAAAGLELFPQGR